jgi:predicted nucleic acid-binding Zn ribbon protein
LSGWKEKIQKKYGPHHHCVICGRAVPEEKKYCSQECRDSAITYEKKQKKRSKIQMYFLIGIMAVMFIVMFLLPR